MIPRRLLSILVFALLFSSCQLPRASFQNGQQHSGGYSNVTSDDQLTGNTTKLFSNSTLLSIITQQNSVAILHNCTVTYLDSYDNSKMLISNCTSTRLQALGSSNATVNYSAIGRIWATSSTTVKVLNSSKVAFLETAANSQVFVNDTQVGELTLNLPAGGFCTGLLNVDLVRSSVEQLNVYANSGYMSVQRIQLTNMTFANILGKDGSPSLILQNTSIRNVVIYARDTRIHVNGCHLNKLYLGGYASALIENSTVDFLVASGDALAIISSSEIDETFTGDNSVITNLDTRIILTRYEIYAGISTIIIVVMAVVAIWLWQRGSRKQNQKTHSSLKLSETS